MSHDQRLKKKIVTIIMAHVRSEYIRWYIRDDTYSQLKTIFIEYIYIYR